MRNEWELGAARQGQGQNTIFSRSYKYNAKQNGSFADAQTFMANGITHDRFHDPTIGV
jgi:hypothetical protein